MISIASCVCLPLHLHYVTSALLLFCRLTQRLQQEHPQISMCGFRTDEVRQQPEGRIGFDVITVKGMRGPLSRINEQVSHFQDKCCVSGSSLFL